MDLFRFMMDQSNQESSNSIPGGFPDNTNLPLNGSSNNNNNSNSNQNNNGSENELLTSASRFNLNKISIIFLQIPLFVFYYIMTLIVTVLSLLNKFIKVTNFYKNKSEISQNHTLYLQSLLESISLDSMSPMESTSYSFGSLYSPESEIVANHQMQNSYTELLEACTAQCKFGLIYLHDPLLDDSMSYVNEILCSEQFVNMVKKYQILIWFGDITKSEGLQVSNALKIRQFPFVGVLTVKSSNKIELIARAEGCVSNYNGGKFEKVLKKHHTSLLHLMQQRQNVEMQRIIREQQDSRFMSSLRRDQQRDRERTEEREREMTLANEQIMEKQWLLWRLQNLQPEPTGSSDVSRIAIRFEGNQRVIRKFSADLPIEEIYAFVELLRNKLVDSQETYTGGNQPPIGYHHHYNFKLISPSPRVELDPQIIIKDQQLIFPSGSILLEETDDV